MIRFIVLLFLALLTSCQSKQNPAAMSKVKSNLDIQGHRGCRGLMPENTLPAFQKALELGVTTLEMDLVISKDHQVVVSHEPFFRAGIALDPDGNSITEDNEMTHNIYELDYERVKEYIVGTLPDSNHLNRTDIKTFKPLFSEVVTLTKEYCAKHKKELPYFNIEIKSELEHDEVYHPAIKTFTQLVIDEVKKADIQSKTCIQSFDLRALQLTKSIAPTITTALLIMNRKTPEENVADLKFTPDIYSCYYKLVDKHLIDYCSSKHIKVIPWTVNTKEDIKAMIEIGVDGIISDYPDLLIETYAAYAKH